MNTIPTTFNERITRYTAVGGKERIASTGISAVILNRPGQPRRSLFQEIEKTGFDNVISIESSAPHYDIEELSGRFPFVRFILPEKEINLGEQINIAACEIESPLFFVMRSDMKIVAGGTARRMAERLYVNYEDAVIPAVQPAGTLNNETDGKKTGFTRLCTVPVIMNSNYEILPSLSAPMILRKKIKTVLMEPQTDGGLSLYPFDGIGIYDRQRFIQVGGYDITIDKPHWQLMDFGFRVFLWGEEIALNLHYKVSYDNELPSEDFTTEESYRRFYLKNIAPVFHGDYAYLPFYNFISFLNKSEDDFFSRLGRILTKQKMGQEKQIQVEIRCPRRNRKVGQHAKKGRIIDRNCTTGTP